MSDMDLLKIDTVEMNPEFGVFHVEQLRWLKRLLRGRQQIFFVAQIVTQSRIQDEAPEDVPLARLLMSERVDHKVMVVFRTRHGMILPAGNNNIEVQPFIQRLGFAQAFAKIPRPQRCHAAAGGNLRCKLDD